MARRSGTGRLFRILLILAVLLAVYFAAAGFVVDRSVGRLTAAGATTEVPSAGSEPMAIGYRGDPGKALGLEYEDVAVQGPDGPLPAWYLGGAGRTGAIYVHGIGGAREDGYRMVRELQRAGLPVLLMTYRGDPGTPAAGHAFGLTEWNDLQAAAEFMAGRGHDRLILVGDSMGAAVIGQFLKQSDLRNHAVALAVDSPALDVPAVAASLAQNLHLPFPGTVAKVGLAIRRHTGGLDLGQARVSDVMAAFPGPMFLAHGTADRIVPVAVSDRLLAARIGITVALTTGADHLGSYAAAPDAFVRAFRAFLTTLPKGG